MFIGHLLHIVNVNKALKSFVFYSELHLGNLIRP